jgi:hypothetical protein
MENFPPCFSIVNRQLYSKQTCFNIVRKTLKNLLPTMRRQIISGTLRLMDCFIVIWAFALKDSLKKVWMCPEMDVSWNWID